MMFPKTNTSSSLLQEIALSEVLQVRGPGQLSVAPLAGGSAHSFEVVTSTLVYCVVAGENGPAWESAIRQALMPVQSSGGGRGEENEGEPGENIWSSDIKYESKTDLTSF